MPTPPDKPASGHRRHDVWRQVYGAMNVTIEHDHAICDGCLGGPAVVSVTHPWFESWERIPMEHGGETHLCPPCVERRDKGWLARAIMECSRCGRNTIDNPEVKDWRLDANRAAVCADCSHEP